MEQYIPKLFEMGAVAAVSVFGYWVILKIAGKGNGYDKKTYEVGQKIATNELVHMYAEMQKQTCQHEEQIKLLTEVCTILRERK